MKVEESYREAWEDITGDINICYGLEDGLTDCHQPNILIDAIVDAYNIIKNRYSEILGDI